ncbi:MAG: CidA/LrgA family protein [Desulfuromonadales bacterium]|nr:CidA/LrgA family protein [Desulfuromonadales bacterium]
MIRGFAVLLTFQLFGEMAVRGFDWPVPGNVVGMALLLIALMLGLIRLEWVTEASELVLSHMALLFVPVGVGVMLYFDLLAREWLPIVAATVLSTFVVIAMTGHVTQGLAKEKGRGEGQDD